MHPLDDLHRNVGSTLDLFNGALSLLLVGLAHRHALLGTEGVVFHALLRRQRILALVRNEGVELRKRLRVLKGLALLGGGGVALLEPSQDHVVRQFGNQPVPGLIRGLLRWHVGKRIMPEIHKLLADSVEVTGGHLVLRGLALPLKLRVGVDLRQNGGDGGVTARLERGIGFLCLRRGDDGALRVLEELDGVGVCALAGRWLGGRDRRSYFFG